MWVRLCMGMAISQLSLSLSTHKLTYYSVYIYLAPGKLEKGTTDEKHRCEIWGRELYVILSPGHAFPQLSWTSILC